jgi:hypothetical protein
VRFLLKGVKIAPKKNLASKMTSFVTEEHGTNYGGRLREVPAEGGENCPQEEGQPHQEGQHPLSSKHPWSWCLFPLLQGERL